MKPLVFLPLLALLCFGCVHTTKVLPRQIAVPRPDAAPVQKSITATRQSVEEAKTTNGEIGVMAKNLGDVAKAAYEQGLAAHSDEAKQLVTQLGTLQFRIGEQDLKLRAAEEHAIQAEKDISSLAAQVGASEAEKKGIADDLKTTADRAESLQTKVTSAEALKNFWFKAALWSGVGNLLLIGTGLVLFKLHIL